MKSILTIILTACAITAAVVDDKVYTPDEVDAKARIKNRLEYLPQRNKDCPDPVKAKIRVVLHKSGKVTEPVILESSGCSYDAEVIRVVRLLKFTPALKDGEPVSQYSELEYQTNSVRRPGDR